MTGSAPLRQRRIVLGLLAAACVAWLVSLYLPSFLIETHAEPYSGAQTLFMGLMFGWADGGEAAYANVAFVAVLIRLAFGGRPYVETAVMLALAATLPGFAGVAPDQGPRHPLGVAAWGWGAALWVLAMVLTALATLARAGLLATNRRLAGALAAPALALAALGLTAMHQRGGANEQERRLALADGMAFEPQGACGAELAWPAGAVVPPGETIALDIDPALRAPAGAASDPALELPKLRHYQVDGHAWDTLAAPGAPDDRVTLRSAPQPRRYTLSTTRTADGALVRLLDASASQPLYAQPLHLRRHHDGSAFYCPLATRQLPKGSTDGVDAALLRALGPQADPAVATSPVPLPADGARTPCRPGGIDIDGIEGLRLWDGREIRGAVTPRLPTLGFCSKDHAMLVSFADAYSKDHIVTGFLATLHVFDRRTLRPLAWFRGQHACADAAECLQLPADLVRGAHFDDRAAALETAAGVWPLTRDAPHP